MAFAVSELASAWNNVDGTSYATTSVSPPASSYLIFGYSSRHGTTAPGVTPPSAYGGTWTELAAAEQVDGISAIGSWGLQCSASPGTAGMTVPVDGGVTAIGLYWFLLGITGHSTSATVIDAEYGPTGTTSTTPGLAAAAPALADSRDLQIFFAAHRANDATTPEAGWTGGTDRAGTLPNYGGRVEWKIGSFDSSPTMTIASSVRWQSMYLEILIDQSAPGPVGDPDKGWVRNRAGALWTR